MKVLENDVERQNSNYLFVELTEEEQERNNETDIAIFAQEWLDKIYDAKEGDIEVGEVWLHEDGKAYRVQWTWAWTGENN